MASGLAVMCLSCCHHCLLFVLSPGLVVPLPPLLLVLLLLGLYAVA